MTETVINLATFKELQDTAGADFVVELLDAFLADAPPLLQALRTTQAAGDVAAFRRAAHSLKSNGSTFGATELSTLARELEETGLTALGERAGAALDRLDQSYAAAAIALKGLCRG